MADEVVILEPGDERAQKILKAMASQTASDILQLLAENQKSLTEITEKLAIPLTTAKYHIENLLEAGLIKVAEIKYSVKGREIKIYAVTDQLLIVAPRQTNVRSLLLKYASLFGIVLFGSLVIALMSPILRQGILTGNLLNGSQRMAVPESALTSAKAVTDGTLANATVTPEITLAGTKGMTEFVTTNLTPVLTPVPTLESIPPGMAALIPPGSGAQTAVVLPDAAFAFFLGGTLVILILVFYEIYLWKKMKS